jgi:hypothetical protein
LVENSLSLKIFLNPTVRNSTSNLWGILFGIKMKKCTKCNVEKELTCFVKDKQKKDGLRSSCKTCNDNSQYYIKNKDKIILKTKSFLNENPDYLKKYKEENKDRLKEYDKEYYIKNKDKYKKYYEDNKEYFKEYLLKFKIDNPNYYKEYISNRKKIDSIFRFKVNTRGLVSTSFNRKGYKKNSKTEQILGCTIQEFIDYMSSKFTEGMTIDNHGKWHIDHIIPISSVNNIEDIIKLNHYTNLQPLWSEDNWKKGTKIL